MRSKEEQVQRRLANMKPDMRKTYLAAIARKGALKAIKAFCQECAGYERNEIGVCTDLGCPFYAYRPYQTKRTTVL